MKDLLMESIPVMFQRMKTCCVQWLLVGLLTAPAVLADDWTTFRHDNRRSGVTAEKIDAAKLQQKWVWRSASAPQPAWYGPAKVDAFHGFGGFRSMREYDRAFGVIAVGKRVYFASTADDSVCCLDAKTGKEVWSFTTGGPVRIAPTFADGKIYFGSDDGCAYCVDASTGKLVWKVRAAQDDRRVLVNGRMISLWPVRTGVLVDKGPSTGSGQATAYFAAGLLPWRTSWLCAVDAATGKVQRAGRFRRRFDASPKVKGKAKAKGPAGCTPEGAMVASADRLLVPQGRVGPRWFKLTDGSAAGGPAGSGGCFAMLTDDGRWISAPGNRANTLVESAPKPKRGAAYKRGIAAVYTKDAVLVITPKSLIVQERKFTEPPTQPAKGKKRGPLRKPKWNKKLPPAYSIIAAGDVAFVGCQDVVIALAVADGKELWRGGIEGKAYDLAVAEGRLMVSTDAGVIHCFAPTAPEPWKAVATKPQPAPKPGKQTTVWGPYVRFTSPATAEVRWRTDKAIPTKLVYGRAGAFKTIEDKTPRQEHKAVMTGLARNAEYTYNIQTAPGHSLRYVCDTFFNYTLPKPAGGVDPFGRSKTTQLCAATAENILAEVKITDGVCLVLGFGSGELAWELVKRSNLRVIGVDTDLEAVGAARGVLRKTGLYGSRISVVHVKSLGALPWTGGLANLIVSQRMLTDGRLPGRAAEVYRMLQPGRGVAHLAGSVARGKLDTWLGPGKSVAKVTPASRGLGVRMTRAAEKGRGVWTHEYGTVANAGYGGETLGGVSGADEMAVQWLGRPGPRYQTDRNGRKPSPLSAGGRLFVQGQSRILAIDASNGAPLWSLEIPLMQRMNVPIDSSNWCADGENLYAVVKNSCWQIDAATGRVQRRFAVLPGKTPKRFYEWGYVARAGDKLLGTPVVWNTPYLSYWGRRGWYDHWQIDKVCTDTLFALDVADGTKAWQYRGGMILHSTISSADGKVFFLECRNEKVLALPAGRVRLPELWKDQFLVCVNLADGKMVWESPVTEFNWANVIITAVADGKVVLGGVSSPKKNVAEKLAICFDAAAGKRLWLQRMPGGGGHGGSMSRPAIAGGKVYLRPMVIDLATGKVLPRRMPGGGCGTYSLSEHLAVFRAGTVTMWNPETNHLTHWARLRPDCWLSTIPAAGMILSPEGGGGCTCGKFLETSIAFAPKRDILAFEGERAKFVGSLEVSLRSSRGMEVRYTLDGSEPTGDSPKYTGPITLKTTALVRARGVQRLGPFELEGGSLISRRFECFRGRGVSDCTVSFRPAKGKPPAGVLIDSGEPLAVRKNGHAYGWDRPMQRLVAAGRSEDPLTAGSVTFVPQAVWSIGVQNGTYEVTVCIGGARRGATHGTVYVNGVEFCKALKVAPGKPQRITRTINVRDGAIRLRSHNDPNRRLVTRISYIRIQRK